MAPRVASKLDQVDMIKETRTGAAAKTRDHGHADRLMLRLHGSKTGET